MIGYSDATIIISNHTVKDLVRFFRVSSAGVLKLVLKTALI